MVSEKFARDAIADARGILLILMQENDEGRGALALADWAEEVYQATVCLEEAVRHLDRAALL